MFLVSFSAALSLFCRRIFTALGTEAFPWSLMLNPIFRKCVCGVKSPLMNWAKQVFVNSTAPQGQHVVKCALNLGIG